MNGGPGSFVPLVGQQQQQQQAMAHQMVVSCYLSLVPIVAQVVLAQPDMYAAREEIPDRIADEAWRVTAAAVKKIGIKISEERPAA
jgi:hypothetical protein